jgi:hypothetical protein
MIEDDAIREIVKRLARPGASGVHTIERAAILAEGSECAGIEAWIIRQGGEAHVDGPASRGHGLHAEREQARSSPASAAPSRYVLPASSLA